jgi:DNA-binding NarL/FixJ family response regulator
VLRCLAAGRTDRDICQELSLSPKTVATHVAHIFTKLDLPVSANDNRRVHAVLTYLERA